MTKSIHKIINFFVGIFFNTLYYIGLVISYTLCGLVFCIFLILGIVFLPFLENTYNEARRDRIKERINT